MLLALMLALSAQGAGADGGPPSMPDDTPPMAGAPDAPPRWHGGGMRRDQIFIAPSGQPFKAAPDAPFPSAAWFAAADADHDGKLTQSEFTADFMAYVASLDSNHDGVIDAGEVKAYEDGIAAMMPQRPQGGGGWQGRGGEGAGDAPRRHHDGGDDSNRPKGEARFAILPLAEPVAAMDTAGDGRITMAEVQAAAAARFAQLDSKHQGYLLLADLPQTPAQQMRARMRERFEHGGGAGGWGGGADGPGPMEPPPGDPGQ